MARFGGEGGRKVSMAASVGLGRAGLDTNECFFSYSAAFIPLSVHKRP